MTWTYGMDIKRILNENRKYESVDLMDTVLQITGKRNTDLETKPNMHATKDLYGYKLTAAQISQMTKDYDV